MGLIDLKTDLKSLRYEDKPYVTKDINNPPSSDAGLGMQGRKRLDDLSRITQMLVDRPGLKFIGNQALIQQVDITDKIEKEKDKNPLSFGKALLRRVGQTAINTTKVIGSTLAQVPVNGTGTHFLHGFRTNTYLQPLGDSNTPAFLEFFGQGGIEGAPLARRGETITGKIESELTDSQSASTLSNQASNNVTKERLREVNPEGLQSKTTNNYSEGDLTYEKVEQRGEVENNLSGSRTQTQLDSGTSTDISIPSSVQPKDLSSLTSKDFTEEQTYQTVINSGSIVEETFNTDGVQDVDTETYPSERTPETKKTVYLYEKPRVTKERKLGFGDQGARTIINTDPQKKYAQDLGLGDRLNLMDVVEGGMSETDVENAKDIIPFSFNIITPDTNYHLNFRAFLDEFSDKFNGSWNTTKYIGRAEDIYSYQGFSREVSIGFKIAAFSRAELKPLYRKLVTLASVTAPTYGGDLYMRESFAEVTVGDYLVKTPGIIDNVNISWQQDYPWEIRDDKELEKDVQILPHVLDVSLSFKVIHNFVAETGILPYITNTDTSEYGNPFMNPATEFTTIQTTQQPETEDKVTAGVGMTNADVQNGLDFTGRNPFINTLI